MGILASASAAEMSGTVLSWDQELGALHVRKDSGTEVVVPVLGETEIRVEYEDIASGNLFAEGDQVRVSREGDGPLRVELLPGPDPEVEDEPLSQPAHDETDGPVEVAPLSSPTPVEGAAAEEPSPVPTASPIPSASPTADEN